MIFFFLEALLKFNFRQNLSKSRIYIYYFIIKNVLINVLCLIFIAKSRKLITMFYIKISH